MLDRIARRAVGLVTPNPKISFVLPPKNSRFCTEVWQDDAYYFSSALKEVHRLTNICGLSDSTRFLDIGSGQGRLAIGLQAMYPKLQSYTGLDVHKRSVEWCNQNLSKPNFKFVHVDTANERYNPRGRRSGQLPAASGSADLIFLYSVFTHMRLGDIKNHLAEIARILSPGGKCFLTIYVENWPKPEEENPAGYLSELGPHSGALHRVVIDKSTFEEACKSSGLNVDRQDYRSETVTKQSVYILSKL